MKIDDNEYQTKDYLDGKKEFRQTLFNHLVDTIEIKES